MNTYKIEYSCGLGKNYDYTQANNINEALTFARNMAIEEYYCNEGLYDIRSLEDVALEDYGACGIDMLHNDLLYKQICADYILERDSKITYATYKIFD